MKKGGAVPIGFNNWKRKEEFYGCKKRFYDSYEATDCSIHQVMSKRDLRSAVTGFKWVSK